jgi:hypothetical protein
MQLAKRASKKNQQATQARQQRIFEEGNKYLKQVAERQNLTLAGHSTMAGHSTVAERPRQGASTITGLTILEGHLKTGGLAILVGTSNERSTRT